MQEKKQDNQKNQERTDQDIIIPNKQHLRQKIEQCKKTKDKGFHIVADFDRTLTKAFMKGRKTQSSYAFIREGKYLKEEYEKQSHDLFNKYFPIEQDANIPLEEKNKKMNEWWEKHYTLKIKAGMHKNIIKDIIAKNKIELRDGTEQLLETLNKNNIPLLIFSAGLGDLIKEFLRAQNMLKDSVHIISNFFTFDKDGKAIDYTKPLIHSFNKNEVQVKHHVYHKEIETRKNVILLGDTLGDLGMCDGLDHDTIIKVGFLNDKVEENLEKFKQNFDVIILNDGPMNAVNRIVEEMII